MNINFFRSQRCSWIQVSYCYSRRHSSSASSVIASALPINSEPISYNGFDFKVLKQSTSCSRARRCTISTPHGDIQTPAFIFCATKAALKGGLTPDMVRARMLTANAACLLRLQHILFIYLYI